MSAFVSTLNFYRKYISGNIEWLVLGDIHRLSKIVRFQHSFLQSAHTILAPKAVILHL